LLILKNNLMLNAIKFHVMILPILEYTKGMAKTYG
jgi:hypothetical protein